LKKITLLAVSVLLLFLYSPAFAKKDKDGQGNNSKKNAVVQQEDEDTAISPKEAARVRNTVRKLNKITNETEDPEIGEEADELAEEQENIEDRVEETIETVDKRSSVMKFLIGPDYKNLGQLRKEVVHTRNNVRQLEHLKEKAGENEQGSIEAAIHALLAKASGIQADIIERSSGFSLFGWLTRWLGGYDQTEPPTEPTPEPTVEPTITPADELSPTVTVTPVVTLEPTEEPTVSPEVTP
jgi:hypothetical protein